MINDLEAPASTSKWDRGRSVAIWLVVLFVAAFAIRMLNLDTKSLWIDEGSTGVIAAEDIDEIMTGQLDYNHPPGYYALIHYVSQVDDSEAALRLPSAIASGILVVVVYLLASRLWGRRGGIIAAGLAAISPLCIWYAQEARQPAIAALMVGLGYLALSRGSTVGNVVASAVLLVGLFMDYVVLIGWTVAGAVWIVLKWRQRRYARDWALVTLISVAAFYPIDGAKMVSAFNGLLDLEDSGYWYGDILGATPLTSNFMGLLVLTFLGVFLGSALLARMFQSERWSPFAVSLIIAGYALVTAAVAVPRAFSVKKILVVFWPAAILAVAYVIGVKLSPRLRTIVLTCLLLLTLASAVLTYLQPKDDWRAAVAMVNSQSASGDAAWVSDEPWGDDAYEYYRGVLPVFREANPISLPTSGDVWLITKRRPQDSIPAIEAEEWFADNWILVEETPFHRLAVQRYRSPG